MSHLNLYDVNSKEKRSMSYAEEMKSKRSWFECSNVSYHVRLPLVTEITRPSISLSSMLTSDEGDH